MARGTRLKLNIGEFNAFRNSEAVTSVLEGLADEMKARAEAGNRFHTEPGDAFRVTTVHNRSRAVVFVSTANFDGVLAESVDRTLSKAVE
jgi:hypothetical protein